MFFAIGVERMKPKGGIHSALHYGYSTAAAEYGGLINMDAVRTIQDGRAVKHFDFRPIEGFDFDKVAEFINLPDDHVVAMFIAIDKAAKTVWPRSGQLGQEEIVVENRLI